MEEKPDGMTLILLLVFLIFSMVSARLYFLYFGAQEPPRADTDIFTVSYKIAEGSVQVYAGFNLIEMDVQRQTGPGKTSGFYVVIEDAGKKNFSQKVSSDLAELQTITVSLDYSFSGLIRPSKILIIPILIDKDGEEIRGKNVSEYLIQDSDSGFSKNMELENNKTCISGKIENCYTGPIETRQVGICRDGEKACINETWSSCENQTTPQTEDCADSLDNDCDGFSDQDDADCLSCLEKEICGNDLDDDCDGFSDQDDADCRLMSKQNQFPVIWYLTWGDDASLIPQIASSGVVTHVVINALDFNELPTLNSDIINKINLAKANNLKVILKRNLWFEDGDRSSQDFALPFADAYTDASILYRQDYYEWFLERLHIEAEEYDVETAIDTEAYGYPLMYSEYVNMNSNHTAFVRLQNIISSAIQLEGKSGYIFPSEHSNTMPESGIVALSELGEIKISEFSYLDCPWRFNWLNNQDVDILGIWVTTDQQCYRPSDETSCITSDYNPPQHCSTLTDRALWTVDTIYRNVDYWYGQNRGLFIYSSGSDRTAFIQEFNSYCQENKETCERYKN
ncbi:MAG: hypothetical protein KKE05_06390 [Nanoarchaeota archaeon]|nr:hypothetical protein [Nanoarchaeota archaeon]